MRRCAFAFALLVATLGLVAYARALPEYARQTKAACAVCHANPAGGGELSAAGKAFQANHKKAPAAGATSGADYVGVMRCRSCHIAEFTAWKSTPHAHALATLSTAPDSAIAKMAASLKVTLKAPAASNDACVVCHVTGFHLPGGHPAADSLKNVAVSNVTCESCHGPGGRHVTAALAEKKKTIQRAVSPTLCVQCHTTATSPSFAFDEYRKRDPHMTPPPKSEN
jgi:hypothetical protein